MSSREQVKCEKCLLLYDIGLYKCNICGNPNPSIEDAEACEKALKEKFGGGGGGTGFKFSIAESSNTFLGISIDASIDTHVAPIFGVTSDTTNNNSIFVPSSDNENFGIFGVASDKSVNSLFGVVTTSSSSEAVAFGSLNTAAVAGPDSDDKVKSLPDERWNFAIKKLKRLSTRPRLVGSSGFSKHSVPVGEVFTHGSGECDQLGLGDGKLERKKPTSIDGLRSVYKISVGSMHTAVLTTDRRVFTWGCNDDCALGRIGVENEPGEIVEFRQRAVEEIDCGDSHTAALIGGRVYCWGTYKTSERHLGFPDFANPGQSVHGFKQLVPTEIKGINGDVIQMRATGNFTAVLSDDGNIYNWGSNEQNQLGFKEAANPKHLFPIKLTSKELNISDCRILNIWTYSYGMFIHHESVAWNPDEKTLVVGCGLNNFGQVGLGHCNEVERPSLLNNLKNVEVLKIVGGELHCCCLTQNGEVLSWGRGDWTGTFLTTNAPKPTPTRVPGLKFVSDIACGGSHTIATIKSGDIVTWGFGESHRLGTFLENMQPDMAMMDMHGPHLMYSKHLQEKFVLMGDGGAQHSVYLAWSGDYDKLHEESRQVETVVNKQLEERLKKLSQKEANGSGQMVKILNQKHSRKNVLYEEKQKIQMRKI
eukprot:GHVL01017886.1.p1 GENE.GHVL01017886.1~~GHVL01017886.1.p1  ORF type:complete len:647 (+),score=108.24 GHVL01017886.1:42-1982(+)